jgi:phosphoglycolate phosphatase
MSEFQLIVFDWDGTLMDSTPHIVNCMQRAISELDLPPLSDEAISHIIGLGLNEAVETLYPGSSPALVQTLANKYREIWLSLPTETPLFDNARELISKLNNLGLFVGVATGKSRRGLDKVLKATELEQAFIATRCADECHSKPHPQMLQEIMDFVAVPPANTLMIGDTEFDLMMAHNAGAHSLAITHGAHPQARLEACEPRGMVNDLHEVERWLDTFIA